MMTLLTASRQRCWHLTHPRKLEESLESNTSAPVSARTLASRGDPQSAKRRPVSLALIRATHASPKRQRSKSLG